jgi:uncharacterized membrane protein YfcA
VVVTAGALVGGVRHARDGHVCWRHALAFTAAALPGAFAGTALRQAVSGSTLVAAFALIMFAAAGAMWRKATAGARAGASDTRAPSCPPLRLARGLAAGRSLDRSVTTAMIAPVIARALAGGHLARRLPQRLLGTGFATLVVLVGAYPLVSMTVLGGPSGG